MNFLPRLFFVLNLFMGQMGLMGQMGQIERANGASDAPDTIWKPMRDWEKPLEPLNESEERHRFTFQTTGAVTLISLPSSLKDSR